MSKRFMFYFWGWLAVICSILIFPTIYGYQASTPDKKFLGVTGIYPTEQYYYLSMGATQGVKEGAWIFADKYDRVPNKKIFINPIANFIVLIRKVTSFSLAVSFNVYRILSCLLLLWGFYHMARQFIPASFSLLGTIILYSVFGGFDFLFKALHIWRIDTLDDSAPSFNMFLSMNGEYYHPLSNALFILTMSFGYKAICKKENVALFAGLLLFVLGAVYVYGMIAAIIILTVTGIYYAFFEKRFFANGLTLIKIFLWASPIVLYYLWLLTQFPEISDSGWFTPLPIITILLSFGFVFIVAAFMGFRSRLSVTKEETFLCLWAITSFIMVQIPTSILPFQIQMIIGVGAPLCVLSGMFLSLCAGYITRKATIGKPHIRSTVYFLVFSITISLSMLTNVKLYIDQMDNIKNLKFPYFLETDIIAAMEWCDKNIEEHKLVIASNELAFIFSGSTGCRVYNGVAPKFPQTKQQTQIEHLISAIVRNNREEVVNRLANINADYIFLDKTLAEENFQNVRNYLSQNFTVCYQNNLVGVYKLKEKHYDFL